MSDSNFEVCGYFETLFEVRRHRTLGTRPLASLGDRRVGVDGTIELELVGTIEVDRGHKKAKFTFDVPTKVTSTVYPLNGRMLAR